MQTQWIVETVVAGKNVVTLRHGIDRAGLDGIAAGLGIGLDDDLLDRFERLEAHALEIHARRQREALTRS
jgi:hypothetical protein